MYIRKYNLLKIPIATRSGTLVRKKGREVTHLIFLIFIWNQWCWKQKNITQNLRQLLWINIIALNWWKHHMLGWHNFRKTWFRCRAVQLRGASSKWIAMVIRQHRGRYRQTSRMVNFFIINPVFLLKWCSVLGIISWALAFLLENLTKHMFTLKDKHQENQFEFNHQNTINHLYTCRSRNRCSSWPKIQMHFTPYPIIFFPLGKLNLLMTRNLFLCLFL